MAKKTFERLLEWAQQPKNYRWLVPLLAVIIVLFVMRGTFFNEKAINGEYEIARDATWYPLTLLGKEKNMLGFADDLIYQIAMRSHLKIRLVSETPGDLLEALDRDADGILSPLTPDVILQEKYLFSEPFYNLGAVLIVDTRSGIKSMSDLEGKFLGVMRGSNVLFGIPNQPKLRVITYDSAIVMLDDVVKDKIDGALLNQLTAYNFVTGYYKGRLLVATPPLTQEGIRLITRKSPHKAKLIEAFNKGLAELKKEGSYRALLDKWDLHDPMAK